MIASVYFRIYIFVKIDGVSIGYVKSWSPKTRADSMNFTKQITANGTYAMKFAEPLVEGTAGEGQYENLRLMKENAAKQWDSPIGTIEASWALYSVQRVFKRSFKHNRKHPNATKAVGATKKFWQRPSANTVEGTYHY